MKNMTQEAFDDLQFQLVEKVTECMEKCWRPDSTDIYIIVIEENGDNLRVCKASEGKDSEEYVWGCDGLEYDPFVNGEIWLDQKHIIFEDKYLDDQYIECRRARVDEIAKHGFKTANVFVMDAYDYWLNLIPQDWAVEEASSNLREIEKRVLDHE